MSAPFATLLLDLTNWDLVIDSKGNIALATAPYALAQDVASAIKTFLGEVYYDSTIGVNYFGQILGQRPSIGVLQAAMVSAALTVPGVVAAVCVIESFQNRKVTGQVQFTDVNGVSGAIGIGNNMAGQIDVLGTTGGAPITIGGRYIEI